MAFLSVILTALSCKIADVRADGLRDTIKDLWGPGGILLEPTPPPTHTPHFSASSLQGLDSLNSALARSLSTFSPSAAVGGFTFDVERGVPLPTTESLGPLLAERAATIGKGKLNVAVTYTRIRYTTFEGSSLNNLALEFQHQDVNNDGMLGGGIFEIERDRIRADLDMTIHQDVLGLFGTYGIAPNWDVGLVVPLQRVFFSVTAHATIVRIAANSAMFHNFGPNSSPQDVRSSGSASGIGDVVMRTKYNFLRGDSKLPDMSLVGRLKLPTGDESDLLGTGETSLTALWVASKTVGPIAPHLNLGYEASTAGSSENAVHYVLGFDARLTPQVTVATEVIGLWKPQGSGIEDNLVDLAFGVKLSLVRNLLVGGNVTVPLNKNEGLRADAIWTIGAEWTF